MHARKTHAHPNYDATTNAGRLAFKIQSIASRTSCWQSKMLQSNLCTCALRASLGHSSSLPPHCVFAGLWICIVPNNDSIDFHPLLYTLLLLAKSSCWECGIPPSAHATPAACLRYGLVSQTATHALRQGHVRLSGVPRAVVPLQAWTAPDRTPCCSSPHCSH